MSFPHRVLLPLLLALTACGTDVPVQPPADAGLAPDTRLVLLPAVEVVASSSMTLEFAADVAGATFECSLDGAVYAACVTPHTYEGLADGTHVFGVRAVLAGQVDATPALASRVVDTTAPDAILVEGPSGTQSATSAELGFRAEEGGATFECSLDGAAFSPCTSPQRYADLAQGAHTFSVRARDGVGNTDASPATRSWTVDTFAPETQLVAGPSEGSLRPPGTESFAFTASETGSLFQCALDAEDFGPCTSPKAYAQLADGVHTFSVRARDAAGNLDPSPTTRSWTVARSAFTHVRLMGANTTSGNYQSYDPGHGTRIFQGLDPDVVLIQEFNYGDNSATALRGFVNTAFGTEFTYFREDGAQIPNGVVSRWPILEAGEWDDPRVSNRDFAWARIDVPGPTDLWAVSVHLLTSSSTERNLEAQSLVAFIQEKVPAGAFLVIGGDFNTGGRGESCVGTLSQVVVTAGPYPADSAGNDGTNASRSKPYDWVLANADLQPHATPVVIGNNSFPGGLVFDSAVYSPLADVSPVLATDSDDPFMQHMAVVRDFFLPN